MKILFIAPLGKKERKKFLEGTSDLQEELNDCIKSYRLAHPESSIDLEVECRTGTDYRDIYISDVFCYFYDKEINELIEEIETLIQSNEIAGLIINPILTYKDEELYNYCSLIPANALETIYNHFSDKLPICYYAFCGCGPFYTTEICKRINKEYSEKGYTKENGYFEIPRVAWGSFDGENESMIKYFIDFYYKRTEDFKLEKIKKEDK